MNLAPTNFDFVFMQQLHTLHKNRVARARRELAHAQKAHDDGGTLYREHLETELTRAQNNLANRQLEAGAVRKAFLLVGVAWKNAGGGK